MAKATFTKAAKTTTKGGAKAPNPWAAGSAGGKSLGNQGAVARVTKSTGKKT